MTNRRIPSTSRFPLCFGSKWRFRNFREIQVWQSEYEFAVSLSVFGFMDGGKVDKQQGLNEPELNFTSSMSRTESLVYSKSFHV